MLVHPSPVLQLGTCVMAKLAERPKVFDPFVTDPLVRDVMHVLGLHLAKNAKAAVIRKPLGPNGPPLRTGVIDTPSALTSRWERGGAEWN